MPIILRKGLQPTVSSRFSAARLFFTIAAFFLLTVVTQVGGLVLLLNRYLLSHTGIGNLHWLLRSVGSLLCFFVLYCVSTIFLVPWAAPYFGRVPLPTTVTGVVRPLSRLTVWLNRHYVQPLVYATTVHVAEEMARRYPGTALKYLDANFPFLNGFPLAPHLSHGDGRKIDFALFYSDRVTGNRVDETPSAIGYGVAEPVRAGEEDKPSFCREHGYWQYSLLNHIVSQKHAGRFSLDEERTAALVELFVQQSSVEKVFIEPHLKSRLRLVNDKVRFHGCRAVRHDDHLHVQIIRSPTSN